MALREWWKDLLRTQVRRAPRRPAPEYAALRLTESAVRQHAIKDISASGVYLVTNETWDPGAPVSLTLQRANPLHQKPEDQITLQATTVRRGQDGVGLAFVLPDGVDPLEWEILVESARTEVAPEDVVAPFRVARAVAFVSRNCGLHGAAVHSRFHREFSNLQLANVVEIVLKADALTCAQPAGPSQRSDPKLIFRILQESSWVDDRWLQQFWGGLLAACCIDGRAGMKRPQFVELFSQLTAMHVRIFMAICGRALFEAGKTSPTVWEAEELMQAAGTRDRQHLDRDLRHLCGLELVAEKSRSASYLAKREYQLIPTQIGLELYSRCHGERAESQTDRSQTTANQERVQSTQRDSEKRAATAIAE